MQPGPPPSPFPPAIREVELLTYREGRAFTRRLGGLHIPVQGDFYGAGDHDWPYWQRELKCSLPLLLGALGARS
jgi:diacylglycerol O-acyltransferase/trehalose O-mycolyltransferase